MSNIPELDKSPEMSFIDNMTLQETEDQLRANFIRIYREQTGKEPELTGADVRSLMIKAFSLLEYQTMQYVDAKGRAEMLKTSTGAALDELAALIGLARRGAERATAKMMFSVAEARTSAIAVPAGTRIKTQDERYFNTIDYAEIKAGQTDVEVLAQAEKAGAESDGIQEGDINILVDPIPYVANVKNTTKSTGGIDVEDDDTLTRRIYLAPSVYSCAGPRDAYEYYTREWRGDVADVRIDSPAPCEVDVYFVIEDETGVRLPNTTERESLKAYLDGDSIRPLCDKVSCLAPEEVEYSIDVTYWIAESEQRSAKEIQSRVNDAVQEYQIWQRKLGRDVNPTELIAKLREAGAKRVKLTEPVDVKIKITQLPRCKGTTVTYGGLEDD